MSDLIDVSHEGDLWVVTLNRSDKANALTADMLNQLADIAQDARHAKAFILTGRGKIFSAGADLADVGAGLATDPAWERLSANIVQINGLTVAALNGTVAGGAHGMVLACDLRIAATHTKFFYPVMKIGVMPQPSDPIRMAKLIGPARTKMILLAGQKIAAETAQNWGLVDAITKPDALLQTAKDWCGDVLGADHRNAPSIKAAIDRA